MKVHSVARRAACVATVAVLAVAGCNGLVQSSANDAGTDVGSKPLDATTSAVDATVSTDSTIDSSAELDGGEAGDTGCTDYVFPDGAPGCGGYHNLCCCGTCGGGLLCRNGICEDCGSFGHMCCPGRTCQADTVCVDAGEGMCTSCGDPGNACCAGDSCYGSSVCDSGTCQ